MNTVTDIPAAAVATADETPAASAFTRHMKRFDLLGGIRNAMGLDGLPAPSAIGFTDTRADSGGDVLALHFDSAADREAWYRWLGGGDSGTDLPHWAGWVVIAYEPLSAAVDAEADAVLCAGCGNSIADPDGDAVAIEGGGRVHPACADPDALARHAALAADLAAANDPRAIDAANDTAGGAL